MLERSRSSREKPDKTRSDRVFNDVLHENFLERSLIDPTVNKVGMDFRSSGNRKLLKYFKVD